MTSAFPLSGMVNHPALGRVRYQVTEISDDPDTQVEQTIELMRRYTLEDAGTPLLKSDAATAMQGDPIADTWAYLSRKDGIRQMQFVHDEDTARPWGDIGRWSPIVETLMRPVDQVVAPRPQGDCDDFAMYGAAHLLARGVPCSFCTVAADSNDPSIYSHVYLVAYPQTGPNAGRRVPLDLSHGWYAGWETDNKFGKRREWPVSASPAIGPCMIAAGVLAGGFILYKMCRGRSN
jgi:hypothetical protein